MPRRPPRLSPALDVGLQAYSLAATTHRRCPVFRDDAIAQDVIRRLLESAAKHAFALPAYCLMPDHAHVLLEASTPACDFLACVARWRQRTGRTWKRHAGTRLWQEGYWDRILRAADDERTCAAEPVDVQLAAGARLTGRG